MKPLVMVSMGDPAGIGPEIVVRCFEKGGDREDAAVAVAGDPAVLRRAAGLFCPSLRVREISRPGEAAEGEKGTLPVLPSCSVDLESLVIGRPSAAGGRAALESVLACTDACISKEVSAMVTAPLSKEAVEMAGEPFTGHTEWIARRCREPGREMMLMASPRINAAFATTHVSIRRLPELLDKDRILRCLRLTHDFLRESGSPSLRVAVCGLNPHAGESGLFGDEEAGVIAPAIAEARALGLSAEGPFPADTIFVPRLREGFGAFLAMYHDQGGIPFKMLSFDDGVNITLGLSVIRTSVDHGTAWGLAWKGLAGCGSLEAAVTMAARLAAARTGA